MQTALRLTARVQPGHKLEIIAPELAEGAEVDILVVPSSAAPIDTMPAIPEEARAAFARRLLEQGAIPFIPAGRSGPPPRPITVLGQPVSETIIEERR